MKQFLLLSQYCSFLFSQVTSFYCQFRLYRHHTIGLLSNFHHNTRSYCHIIFIMRQLKILFSTTQCISSCGNSRSWSHHQICDTSFSCITLLVLLKVKFYVFEYMSKCKLKSLFIVVSTSPVVWSQVRWFFLMRNVFCAINHDE